jgi:hypothetical protein
VGRALSVLSVALGRPRGRERCAGAMPASGTSLLRGWLDGFLPRALLANLLRV